MRRGGESVHGDAIGAGWIACAKHPVSEAEYRHCLDTGRWASEPPTDVPHAEVAPDPAAPPARPRDWVPPIGDNSGAVDTAAEKRSALMDDIAEARRYYKVHPIKTKADADKCENWRSRIAALAKEVEALRMAQRRPLLDELEEIQATYKPALDAAAACAGARGELDTLGQAWLRAERERLRKEAEERAHAEAEARRAAVEAERERIEAERALQKQDDPVAFHTTPEPELPVLPEEDPVVAAPKVMIGTGAQRRGFREERPTATITDLKAAAAYYADIKHPDLVALIQTLANAAARSKARMPVPGCRMSWEGAAGKAA
jgi:hypothetical protein